MFHTAARCPISSIATVDDRLAPARDRLRLVGAQASPSPLRRLNAAYRYVHIRLCSSSAASARRLISCSRVRMGVESCDGRAQVGTRRHHPREQSADRCRRPAAPVGKRYRLGAEIARGGMGRVVEATDTVLGRTVALKEVLPNAAPALARGSARGRDHRAARASVDRAGPRRRAQRRRRAVLRDAQGAGPPLDELVGTRARRSTSGSRWCRTSSAATGDRARAPARRGPPRHQAVEHPRRRSRRDDRDRLGPREGDRRGRTQPASSSRRAERGRLAADRRSARCSARPASWRPSSCAAKLVTARRRLRARRDAVSPARAASRRSRARARPR